MHLFGDQELQAFSRFGDCCVAQARCEFIWQIMGQAPLEEYALEPPLPTLMLCTRPGPLLTYEELPELPTILPELTAQMYGCLLNTSPNH